MKKFFIPEKKQGTEPVQKPAQSARPPASVFSLEGIPPTGQLIPLGLQHVVAAVVGIITLAIMVANTSALSDADRTLLIQVSLIVTALVTLTVVVLLQNFGKSVLKRAPFYGA